MIRKITAYLVCAILLLSPAASRGQEEAVTGVDLFVSENGLYRVTCENIETAGVDPSVIPVSQIRLTQRGIDSAVSIVAAGSYLAPGDYLEFYGEALDTQFTGTNVYRLTWSGTAGPMITGISGAPSGEPVTSANYTVHFEENHVMWPETPGAPESDYWFREKLTAPVTVQYTLTIPSPTAGTGDATALISFRGRSNTWIDLDHHVHISLNGTAIGDIFWDGEEEYLHEITIAGTLLEEGANALKLELPGDTGAETDIVYFNWIDITYRRDLEADSDVLPFSAAGTGSTRTFEVSNLGDDEISVLDISDPASPRKIEDMSVTAEGGSFSVLFDAIVQETATFHVTAGSGVKTPERIACRYADTLTDPNNGADYILITAEDFLDAVEPVLELRELQGLRVRAVSVEDIYGQFNEGIVDPAAVKEFIQYAYENWQRPAPRYVFLVGDASIDYRDYFGTGKMNRVPVHLTITEELGLTPSDNWYVCLEGDDIIPEMYIGRIPGATAADVARTINKITGYELAADYEPRQVLFVADDDDISFEVLNDELANGLPEGFTTRKIYAASYAGVNGVTDDIIEIMEEGVLLTNYVGHGDLTRWGGGPTFTDEFIFESFDVKTLENAETLAFVIALDCLNGYFAQPYQYSLGEEFVITSNGGAIATFSPSGLAYLSSYEILNRELFSRIFDGEDNIIGSITTEAKIASYVRGESADIVEMFHLVGDPATRLKIYQTGPIAGAFTITATSGSNGTISPAGTVRVIEGTDQTFTITPDAGYRIADVLVDGSSVGAVDTYTFENIQADHTIAASFRLPSGSSGDSGGGGCFISSISRK
ncbi:MAG: hypothetical protein JXO48_08970 [Deltaproteobacteria bacterium]|nr:hypothetical protein [Deltaproteobacteria bacterium]